MKKQHLFLPEEQDILKNKMKKIIKKYGDSIVIRFSSEEVKIYDLKVEDIVEIHLRKLGKNDEKACT